MTVRRAASVLVVAAAMAVSACRTAGQGATPTAPARLSQRSVSDRLFFGRNIPAGGQVSMEEWQRFLREVVTPRFPDGLTVWEGSGQWLDPRGVLVREPVFVVEVFHRPGEAIEKSIAFIAAEYRKRFGQDAVLRVSSPAGIRVY